VNHLAQKNRQNSQHPASLEHGLMEDVSLLMRPVVRWAVRRGLGHAVISRWLKPIFLQEAQQALQAQAAEPTDSALALAAGLHRGDIHQLQSQQQTTGDIAIPVTHQVLANWLLVGLPAVIPFKSTSLPVMGGPSARSFVELVHRTPKAASQGFSASLILHDMVRQGLVTELPNGDIHLQAFGHAPRADASFAVRHLSEAAHDLLSAGLHNLEVSDADRFLEQSLEVDGLHQNSVDQLHELAVQQWQSVLQALLPSARACSDRDEPQGGRHRLRLGVYFYADSLSESSHPHLSPSHPREGGDPPSVIPAKAGI
jgi:hypothetical protein